MANSLLSLIGGGGNNFASILLQAVGAALRGESPQDFLRNLANSNPQMRGMDFSNPQGTAQQLCQQRGINADELAKKVDGAISPMLPK